MTATVSAVAGLDAAEATLARWQAEVAAKGAELTDLRGRAGEEALDDPAAAAGLAAAISLLSGEVQVAELAVVPAAARVEAARRAVLRERAEALTARVTRLRVAAAKRQERTDRLLAELLEHEDARYVPWEPPPGQWGQPGETWQYSIPVTQLMLNSANGLESTAVALTDLADSGAMPAVLRALGQAVPEVLVVESALRADGSVEMSALRSASTMPRARV
jgi:hypothetical protein